MIAEALQGPLVPAQLFDIIARATFLHGIAAAGSAKLFQ
jgi:hypothetical protein